MSTLFINETNGKGINEAIELLKANGFKVTHENSLKIFCREEAEYRLDEISLDCEQIEIYNKLNDNEKEELINLTGETLFESQIFDYDYMDFVVSKTFHDYINGKNL